MPAETPRENSAMHSAPKPSFDVAAREAYITGRPPRIPPVKQDELSAEALETVANLRKAIGSAPPEDVPESIATMLHYPRLYERHVALAMVLYTGELSTRDRELAILRTGWLCKAPYEWTEHVLIGKRMGGMTTEEIERVTHGSSAPGWNEHERALLRAVEELHEDAMISDEVWSVLAKTLNPKQLIELPVLIGQYQGLAYLQNSLRMRLMPGGIGLSAR